MVKYEDICKAVKKLDNTIEFVNLRDMESFAIEKRVTKDGKL